MWLIYTTFRLHLTNAQRFIFPSKDIFENKEKDFIDKKSNDTCMLSLKKAYFLLINVSHSKYTKSIIIMVTWAYAF